MGRTAMNEIPKLHEVYKDYFHVGAAINPLTMERERDLIKYHFNSLTAENVMKFEGLQPEEGKFTFEEADALVAFAQENGMHVRGHTLVWHNQTPGWVFEDGKGGAADRETLLTRMKTHIDTVVGRYKGKIYAWDVVNEAIFDKGEEPLLRQSDWLQIAGENYIAKAFEYAHASDPDALLFYNDYHETQPLKREKMYKLVESLVDQGVPIHGVGLQCHWNLEDPSMDELRQAIERFATLGLKLHVTELDISVHHPDDKRTHLTEPEDEMLVRQAERYDQIFKVFREYSSHLSSVTFWGVADNYTWLDATPKAIGGRKNWPFVFDVNGKPKQSFWNIVNI